MKYIRLLVGIFTKPKPKRCRLCDVELNALEDSLAYLVDLCSECYKRYKAN